MALHNNSFALMKGIGKQELGIRKQEAGIGDWEAGMGITNQELIETL